MDLKEYLRQRYAESRSAGWKWLVVAGVSVFVYVFLIVFKPSSYIYEQARAEQHLVAAGFTLVTAAILFILKFLVEPRIISPGWTLGMSILWGLCISACIGVGGFFYIVLLFERDIQIEYVPVYLKYLLYSILTALLVGSVPITIRHLIHYILIYRRALRNAGLLHEVQARWEDLVNLKAGVDTNQYIIDPRKIVCISSDDNYLTVHSMEGDTLKKQLIRGTLKAAEQDLKNNNRLVRCHKSHIVNLTHFNEARGHSQNLRLISGKHPMEIPVSRSKARWISRQLQG